MRVSFTARKPSLVTRTGSLLTMVVMPLAKNIPAREMIKGWMPRWATKKP